MSHCNLKSCDVFLYSSQDILTQNTETVKKLKAFVHSRILVVHIRKYVNFELELRNKTYSPCFHFIAGEFEIRSLIT